MQLKRNHPELIKEEIFEKVYQQVLKGENKDPRITDLVFNYFYGNPKLFNLYYQNPHEHKKCYACGLKGHIKGDCKVQGLAEVEEEIEWVFSKPIRKQPEVIKRKEFYRQPEVPFEDIPDDPPYEFDPYED